MSNKGGEHGGDRGPLAAARAYRRVAAAMRRGAGDRLEVQAFFTLGFAALLLRERLRATQLAGPALAACGLVLVASGLDGVATPAGFALVIAAAAAWGVGNVAIKRAGAR